MNMYPRGCIEIMFICRVAIYWIYYPRSCWVILNNVLKLLFLSVTNRWCQNENFYFIFLGQCMVWVLCSLSTGTIEACGHHSISYCRVVRQLHQNCKYYAVYFYQYACWLYSALRISLISFYYPQLLRNCRVACIVPRIITMAKSDRSCILRAKYWTSS